MQHMAHEYRWPQVVFSLLISALYCLAIGLFMDRLLADNAVNVNRHFVRGVGLVLLGLGGGLLGLIFLIKRIRSQRVSRPILAESWLDLGDVLFVLLPLTPVVQYVLNNQDILPGFSSFLVVAALATAAFCPIIFVPSLFANLGAGRPLLVIGTAFAFTFANMASLTAGNGWFEYGDLRVQLALFFTVLTAGVLVDSYLGRNFARTIVVLYFVSNSIYAYSVQEKQNAGLGPTYDENNLVQLVGTDTPPVTPNIYILVYDAYVANETILSYGLDNSEQEAHLVELGFRLYPHMYSIGGFTVSTMSRVLSASAAYSGMPREAVSGAGAVHHLLQGFGYKTHGLFWSDYFFQGAGTFYNYSFPALTAPHWVLIKAITMGEFRFDVEFDSPERSEFTATKNWVFSKKVRSPKFVYMHDNLPSHSQNSGKCLPDEVDLFAARLALANIEMKDNLAAILSDDPGALIVVAGDHGPYLTGNCTNTAGQYDAAEISRQDIQDRFGAFLAIRWPDEFATVYDDMIVLQDLFPAIFATIFDDPKYLAARVNSGTTDSLITSDVMVFDGIIQGGIHAGEALFLSPK